MYNAAATIIPVLRAVTVTFCARSIPLIRSLLFLLITFTEPIPCWFPTNELPDGFNTRQPKGSHGLTHVHHFYTKRVEYIISMLWKKLSKIDWGHFIITSFIVKTGSKLHNIGFKNGKINLAGAMPNVYYVPSSIAERNIFTLFILSLFFFFIFFKLLG